jgi:hypothetical protein
LFQPILSESGLAIAKRMMADRQRVRQCDIEVMKMAMLKHEETFRQQVIMNHQRKIATSFFLSSWKSSVDRMSLSPLYWSIMHI